MACSRASVVVGTVIGVPLGLVVAHEYRRRVVVPRAETLVKDLGWLLGLSAGELADCDAHEARKLVEIAQNRIAVSRSLGRFCPVAHKNDKDTRR